MSAPRNEDKEDVVKRLMKCKEKSGKSFDDIAKECKITNAYAGQLFFNQAQLHPSTESRLRRAVPALNEPDNEDLLKVMRKPPFRDFDEGLLLNEPLIYRLYEVILQYGETIKEIVNEQHGDGIMSAVDFMCKVEKKKGKSGEGRVVITFDGKFLPFKEQTVEDL